MREIAWFLEWNGDLALAELTEMEREACHGHRTWPLETVVSVEFRKGARYGVNQ